MASHEICYMLAWVGLIVFPFLYRFPLLAIGRIYFHFRVWIYNILKDFSTRVNLFVHFSRNFAEHVLDFVEHGIVKTWGLVTFCKSFCKTKQPTNYSIVRKKCKSHFSSGIFFFSFIAMTYITLSLVWILWKRFLLVCFTNLFFLLKTSDKFINFYLFDRSTHKQGNCLCFSKV